MPDLFVLVQISDPHIGATWAGGDPVANLASAVDEVRLLSRRPDAVVVTGDLAETACDTEYESVRGLLAQIDAPVYVLAGNHDDRIQLRRHFHVPGADHGAVQYAVDLGPVRLVVLDSTRPGEAHGELDRDRLSWLDGELPAAPNRMTVLAMHHPPIRTGEPAWDDVGLGTASIESLTQIVRRHPQVGLVLGGHMHRTVFSELAGCRVVAAPSTYARSQLDFSAGKLKFVEAPPAFAVHTLVDGEIVSHIAGE